jgi:bis(5'-nucleosidyl)-tetraphosphatase
MSASKKIILSAGIIVVRKEEDVFTVNPKIGGPEHHEYRWLSYSEFEKLPPSRLLPVINWARGVVEL